MALMDSKGLALNFVQASIYYDKLMAFTGHELCYTMAGTLIL